MIKLGKIATSKCFLACIFVFKCNMYMYIFSALSNFLSQSPNLGFIKRFSDTHGQQNCQKGLHCACTFWFPWEIDPLFAFTHFFTEGHTAEGRIEELLWGPNAQVTHWSASLERFMRIHLVFTVFPSIHFFLRVRYNLIGLQTFEKISMYFSGVSQLIVT